METYELQQRHTSVKFDFKILLVLVLRRLRSFSFTQSHPLHRSLASTASSSSSCSPPSQRDLLNLSSPPIASLPTRIHRASFLRRPHVLLFLLVRSHAASFLPSEADPVLFFTDLEDDDEEGEEESEEANALPSVRAAP